MPLVRIDLLEGKTAEFKTQLGELVYESMLETIGIPEEDKFVVVNELKAEELIFSTNYLSVDRTDGIVIIQITMNEGRTTEVKKALYKTVADKLNSQLDIRKEDVFINLVEVNKENWSFGNGIASTQTKKHYYKYIKAIP
ncbi:tautomerase family protein [Aerococcus urinaeequi]|uniref:tautomerase family protein n=1 Tax=Aerococcus urinaeequi TaxID=51665 RepID=UPI003AAB63D7